MKDEWRTELYLRNDIYWGDLTEEEHFSKYYYLSETINTAIDELKSYAIDIDCYHSVLIAGDAGSGKTSLIQYIKTMGLFPKAYIIILNFDHNVNNKFIIHMMNDKLFTYISTLAIDNELVREKLVEFNSKKNLRSEEKVYYLLKIHDEYAKVKENRASDDFVNLVFVLDQIDLASVSVLEKNIKAIFSILDASKYILKIVCARQNTIKLCRNNTNSLFATTFRRQVVIQPAILPKIINYRLKDCSLNNELSTTNFYKIFDSSKLNMIIAISSNNVRNMIDIISKIINTKTPDEIRESSAFINYLFRNNYIPDLNQVLSSACGFQIPLSRWIFEALFFHNKNDLKLQTLICRSIEKAQMNHEYVKAVTKENMKESIGFLFSNGLIQESVFNNKQIDITKKGQFIESLLKNKNYNEVFRFSEKDFKQFKVVSN